MLTRAQVYSHTLSNHILAHVLIHELKNLLYMHVPICTRTHRKLISRLLLFVVGRVWTTVFTEDAGTGNGKQHDNSDLRTLNLVTPPFDVTKGNYRVRMEWGSGVNQGWAEFTVDLHAIAGSKTMCAINSLSLTRCLRSGQGKIFLVLHRASLSESLDWKQAPQPFSRSLKPAFATLASKAASGGSTAFFRFPCAEVCSIYSITRAYARS